jgi:hypothetical protein
MPRTLSEQANKAAIDSVRAEKPQSFTVGGTFDGKVATGGVTYDRKWSNLWGITAYAKAYWNDAPVVPTDRFGYVVGADVTKKF